MNTEATILLVGITLLCISLGSQTFKKRGLSPVVGEMLVGVLLGPYGFNILQPTAFLHILAELGLVFLLFETGFETHLSQLWHTGKTALLVAVVGVIVPLLLGTGTGLLLQLPLLTAVLVGATLSATSIGITAKTLQELNLQHRPETAIILGAAVIDDVIGLLILALLQGLFATSTPFTITKWFTGAGVTAWLLPLCVGIVVLLGVYHYRTILTNSILPRIQVVLHWLVRKLIAPKDGSAKEVFVIIGGILCMLVGLNHFLGLSMALGGFMLGLAFQTWCKQEARLVPVMQEVETVGSFIMPFTFVHLGMQLNWKQLIPVDATIFNPNLLWVLLAIVVVAFGSKFMAGFVAPQHTVDGIPTNRTIIGLGMIPRGEVGLIFVQVGLTAGVLSEFWANVLVLAVCLSTLIPPLLLKYVIQLEKKQLLYHLNE
jgi:Kef-type K+ transport system membrane component KefB